MGALVPASESQHLSPLFNVLIGGLPFAIFDHAHPSAGFTHGSREVCLFPA
jgi:hypothetical protein